MVDLRAIASRPEEIACTWARVRVMRLTRIMMMVMVTRIILMVLETRTMMMRTMMMTVITMQPKAEGTTREAS